MTAAERCLRPGCQGGIQDGYCDTCGMAPAVNTGSSPSRTSQSSSRSGRTASGRTSGRTSSRGSSGRSRRGLLGIGLVEVPAVPYRDPATAVLHNPEVAENKRFCSGCSEPVGRSRDDRPGRAEGFCRKCGAAFSFTPKLATGELVGGQYEVLGCLAHGGLGWIYLAKDHNVSDRWVVLKGLLDSGDADSMAAALAERQFLATVEHPNVVKIYNFVEHGDSGYIVMEYVGGQSLKEVALAKRNADGGSLPLPQVIAYGLEVLRALGYLHSLGAVYCDFKPDNAIQTEEQLKLVDLGGVRRLDDQDGPIYGTVGYQAPEIAETGPSISSDLYTVARALAVLSFDFKGFTGAYRTSLPPREQIPLLARYESYDRLLRRATDAEPDRRFWSAEEMAEQLTGVLREVLAEEDGTPRQATSTLFGPELRPVGAQTGTDEAVRLEPAAAGNALPLPLINSTDPGAALLAGLVADAPAGVVVSILSSAPKASPEVTLRLARAHIEAGDGELAQRLLDELVRSEDGDWRADWYRGLGHLVAGATRLAWQVFDDLYGLLPGEAAPKLALAYCAECLGDLAAAERLYGTVWRTDHSYVGAAFGLARVRLAGGDRAGVVAVLDSVPATSSFRIDAQVAAITARVRDLSPAEMIHDELIEAAGRLEALGLGVERRERLAAEVLRATLDWVLDAGGTPAGTVLGLPLAERELRFGLERSFRALARLAPGPRERVVLVDRANSVRPRTLV